ncbi:hypothetical protein ABKV19_011577 [Rosa sericea]
MLFAYPWERITDQLKSSFSSGLSLPQICENFVKAAYDPRIADSCSVQASFVRGVLEKIGVEPQVERIGKYKSAGDQLARTTMSEENCEMLTALLDNIYGNWLDIISSTRGKKREDIEKFVNEGVYQVEKLKEEGWITNIQYDDEVVISGKDKIAIIRASGSISRVRGSFSLPGSSIVGEQFVEKIRTIRESKRYKAAIIRIDSPGGDALASDLMWREIKLLAASKPVIASMSDVAASGGYYMAMAADAIVAENLTLTGSIGVVTGVSLTWENCMRRLASTSKSYQGGNLQRFLQLNNDPSKEAELFAKSAQNSYKQFRDKAASSRSMTVDKMLEVAQGRVWAGKDAASRGLVDAIGGLSRAVAIAKLKANIPQDTQLFQVTLVELAKPSPSLPELLSGVGSTLVGVEQTMKTLLQDLTFSDGVQARTDGILFQRLEGASNANHLQFDKRLPWFPVIRFSSSLGYIEN